jgi:hypothetical protein
MLVARGDAGVGGSGQIQRTRLHFPWADHVAPLDVRVHR